MIAVGRPPERLFQSDTTFGQLSPIVITFRSLPVAHAGFLRWYRGGDLEDCRSSDSRPVNALHTVLK